MQSGVFNHYVCGSHLYSVFQAKLAAQRGRAPMLFSYERRTATSQHKNVDIKR